jgi:hypothetical protein
MSRRTRSLPNIPVKHVAIRKVIALTPPLEAKLHAYIEFYAAQQGLTKAQAPSDADTIVALIDSFLERDVEFNRHLRQSVGRPSARKTSPGAET